MFSPHIIVQLGYYLLYMLLFPFLLNTVADVCNCVTLHRDVMYFISSLSLLFQMAHTSLPPSRMVHAAEPSFSNSFQTKQFQKQLLSLYHFNTDVPQTSFLRPLPRTFFTSPVQKKCNASHLCHLKLLAAIS